MIIIQCYKSSIAAEIVLQTNIRICRGNMYKNNIDLSLIILGLFFVTNVLGAFCPHCSAKNQSSISKDATENTTTLRSIQSYDRLHGEL